MQTLNTGQGSTALHGRLPTRPITNLGPTQLLCVPTVNLDSTGSRYKSKVVFELDVMSSVLVLFQERRRDVHDWTADRKWRLWESSLTLDSWHPPLFESTVMVRWFVCGGSVWLLVMSNFKSQKT